MPEETTLHTDIEMDSLPASPHRQRSRGRSQAGIKTTRRRRDYLVGICLLLVVVVLWTSSNFVTQGLFEDGYEKPFLVTYLNTSAFALYLLPYMIRRSLERWSRNTTSYGGTISESEPLVADIDAIDVQGHPGRSSSHDSSTSRDLPQLTVRETVQLASLFCLLWFIANWTINAALDYTSVASATILSSMSGFFTLGIGRLFRVEALTITKIGAVMTSVGGVALVSLSDSSQPQSAGPPSPSAPAVPVTSNPFTAFTSARILGDCLALLSALFYALYVTLLKVRIRSESRIDMQLFFGFVGLFNILTCWPIGVVLHFTGIERFELPYSSKAVVALLVNMGVTLSSDYIYLLAMLKTTPLVVTVGLSLTMPLAVLGDFFLAKPAKAPVIVGAAVVLFSFILVGWEDARNEEEGDLLTGERLHQGTEEPGVLLREEPAPDA